MTFCMGGTSAQNKNLNATDSTCGRTDISRNTENLPIMSLTCQKTGGSNVCWLGTHDREELDEHL